MAISVFSTIALARIGVHSTKLSSSMLMSTPTSHVLNRVSSISAPCGLLISVRGMARGRTAVRSGTKSFKPAKYKPTVSIILRDDLPSLGVKGQIVRVRHAHMRYNLYPFKLAAYDSAENRRMFYNPNIVIKKKAAKDVIPRDVKLYERLNILSLEIVREHPHKAPLTEYDVWKALVRKDFYIPIRRILLPSEPMNVHGTFTVRAVIAVDKIANIKLNLLAESSKETAKKNEIALKESIHMGINAAI